MAIMSQPALNWRSRPVGTPPLPRCGSASAPTCVVATFAALPCRRLSRRTAPRTPNRIPGQRRDHEQSPDVDGRGAALPSRTLECRSGRRCKPRRDLHGCTLASAGAAEEVGRHRRKENVGAIGRGLARQEPHRRAAVHGRAPRCGTRREAGWYPPWRNRRPSEEADTETGDGKEPEEPWTVDSGLRRPGQGVPKCRRAEPRSDAGGGGRQSRRPGAGAPMDDDASLLDGHSRSSEATGVTSAVRGRRLEAPCFSLQQARALPHQARAPPHQA